MYSPQTLDMDTSTLRRKLAQEGAKFGTVVQGATFGFAKQRTDDTDPTLADVAAAIGIYESSVFTPALRRWSDMTPSEWRMRENESSARRSLRCDDRRVLKHGGCTPRRLYRENRDHNER